MSALRFGVIALVVASGCSGGNDSTSSSVDTQALAGVTTAADADAGASDEVPASGGSGPCDWLTAATLDRVVSGPVTTGPIDDVDDVSGCIWRSADAEITVRFIHFNPGFRSVEAELLRVDGDTHDQLVTVEGVRGAFRRPGVWYGETPLEQYGMAEIHLAPADGSPPSADVFETFVASVIADVIAADPDVPW